MHPITAIGFAIEPDARSNPTENVIRFVLSLFEGLFQIGDDVVNMFDAD